MDCVIWEDHAFICTLKRMEKCLIEETNLEELEMYKSSTIKECQPTNLSSLLKYNLDIDEEIQEHIYNILTTSPFKFRTISYDRVVTNLLLSTKDGIIDYIKVPYAYVGTVVGNKGATIIFLQKKTNTNIVSPSKGMCPYFTLIGEKEEISLAKNVLKMWIEVNKPAKSENDNSIGVTKAKFSERCWTIIRDLIKFDKGQLKCYKKLCKQNFDHYASLYESRKTFSVSEPELRRNLLPNYKYTDIKWLPDISEGIEINLKVNMENRGKRCISTPAKFNESCYLDGKKEVTLMDAMKIVEKKMEEEKIRDPFKHSFSEGSLLVCGSSNTSIVGSITDEPDSIEKVSRKSLFPFCMMCHDGDEYLKLENCCHGPFCEKCCQKMETYGKCCPICRSKVTSYSAWTQTAVNISEELSLI